MSHHAKKGVEVKHDGPLAEYRSLIYIVNKREISHRYDNGNQDTECNQTSVNRCVEVEHLRESID